LWILATANAYFGISRAQGTYLVAANVVLAPLGKLRVLSEIPWLDLRDHFAAAKRGKRKEGERK